MDFFPFSIESLYNKEAMPQSKKKKEQTILFIFQSGTQPIETQSSVETERKREGDLLQRRSCLSGSR